MKLGFVDEINVFQLPHSLHRSSRFLNILMDVANLACRRASALATLC